MWLFSICNEKLTTICIRSIVGHRKYPSCIMLQGIPYLIIEFYSPYVDPTYSCTCWISISNHKTFNVPMKYDTIIISTGTRCQKILCVLGHLITRDFTFDIIKIYVQSNRHLWFKQWREYVEQVIHKCRAPTYAHRNIGVELAYPTIKRLRKVPRPI
jgi:hypothetical protein